ncbi:MAG: DUF4266 domain-containing protein [Deltaproteobacteria bacterium]|nr:DUF4266 domain-containing protein [Deltaproteobacteria bacterium]
MQVLLRLVFVAGVAAISGTGCAEVRPWERGALAHRLMGASARPEREGGRTHVFAVREGAPAGGGRAGGGCGCD